MGTGSIRGMPMLLTLRDAGWAVWPFDKPSSHTLVEIWPRHFTGPVIKSSAVHRAHWLQTSIVALRPDWLDLMHRSEDAFDAGVSAITKCSSTSVSASWRNTTMAAGGPTSKRVTQKPLTPP